MFLRKKEQITDSKTPCGKGSCLNRRSTNGAVGGKGACLETTRSVGYSKPSTKVGIYSKISRSFWEDGHQPYQILISRGLVYI